MLLAAPMSSCYTEKAQLPGQQGQLFWLISIARCCESCCAQDAKVSESRNTVHQKSKASCRRNRRFAWWKKRVCADFRAGQVRTDLREACPPSRGKLPWWATDPSESPRWAFNSSRANSSTRTTRPSRTHSPRSCASEAKSTRSAWLTLLDRTSTPSSRRSTHWTSTATSLSIPSTHSSPSRSFRSYTINCLTWLARLVCGVWPWSF